MDKVFYIANKILCMLTTLGTIPSVIFIVGNNSAGKTTFFQRIVIKWALRGKGPFGLPGKFVWIVRKKGDVDDFVDNWADVMSRWYDGHVLRTVGIGKKSAARIYFDDMEIGYVLPLNSSEWAKNHSLIFTDAGYSVFDEFQNETGDYVPKELAKWIVVRKVLAKGGLQNKAAIVKPMFMLANQVTKYNPYFVRMGVDKAIRDNTKFARGKDWTLEQVYKPEAARQVAEAIGGMTEAELAYSTQNKYLLDSDRFIDDVKGQKSCILNIKLDGQIYSVWRTVGGLYFVSRKLIGQGRFVMAVEDGEHDESTKYLAKSSYTAKAMRKAYSYGDFRFDSEPSRHAFLVAMGIEKALG